MAIKQTNIFPLDKQPRKAVGVAYPFTAMAFSGSATPFKSNYTTKEQVKSNLLNLLENYLNCCFYAYLFLMPI